MLHGFFKEYKDLNSTQLEKIYNGVSYKLEKLQQKMKEDILSNKGNINLPYYDILPYNFPLIDIDYCSFHDKKLLCELHEKRFKIHWLLEYKKAVMSDDVVHWKSEFILYFFRECIDNNVWKNMWNTFDDVFHISNTNSITDFIKQVINMKEELVHD